MRLLHGAGEADGESTWVNVGNPEGASNETGPSTSVQEFYTSGANAEFTMINGAYQPVIQMTVGLHQPCSCSACLNSRLDEIIQGVLSIPLYFEVFLAKALPEKLGLGYRIQFIRDAWQYVSTLCVKRHLYTFQRCQAATGLHVYCMVQPYSLLGEPDLSLT